MPETTPRVLAVSVGRPREFDFHGKPARSSIWKTPVTGRVPVRGVNLAGDDQADRQAHGGPDKAVYAYAAEDARWWESRENRPFGYAAFGENLTTEGIDVNDALVGERWAIGSAVFEISEPRVPCWRLGVRMDDPAFIRRFTEALRPGAYMRIVAEGDVGAGDAITVIAKPDHDLSVRDVFRIYTRDRDECARLIEVPQMSEPWKRWARDTLERRSAKDTPAPTCG
jgi:MOSC domain-containing protein YiiM